MTEDGVFRVVHLIRFVRAARHKKMLDFTEDRMLLTDKYQELLGQMQSSEPFVLMYADLEKLILSQEVTIALETIAILELTAATTALAPFEIPLVTKFIKNCMLTSFPDYRQKYMKYVTAFFIRLRTIYGKDVKSLTPEFEQQAPQIAEKLWNNIQPLTDFLRDISVYA
jgi:hypothetical protein